MDTKDIISQNIEEKLIHEAAELRGLIADIVTNTKVIDIHTHLFPSEFENLSLWGIDELLNYHYLVAETFRSTKISPEEFWKMEKTAQADLIWKTLFVENSPVSEATRGVITILDAFGLNTRAENLREIREFFSSKNAESHISDVLEKACVSKVVMTNDPLDDEEIKIWKSEIPFDKRFRAALRMDRILNSWENAVEKLSAQKFDVSSDLTGKTVSEFRRFLDEWIKIMQPLYMAVSLPDDFKYPADDVRTRIINEIVLPVSKEHNLPFALMIGVRRGVNPALGSAGDGVGFAKVSAVEKLCLENPEVNFLATFLSRENQHELCVSARKFSNLMPFGCWWFLNNPSIIREITSERIELLGTSFIPQHSDSRILEQLIYKWKHSRSIISECLTESYERLLKSGRGIKKSEIERDVKRMFKGNFSQLVG